MKTAVLGLGQSIELFNPEGYNFVIGVNDIWKFHKTDVLCVFDKPDKFTKERIDTINRSEPEYFISHLDDYNTRKDFNKIKLQDSFPLYSCNLDSEEYPISMVSPFIACAIAYKIFEATEIHLFGVDMKNHHVINEFKGKQVINHFKNLKIALKEKKCELIVHGDGILRYL